MKSNRQSNVRSGQHSSIASAIRHTRGPQAKLTEEEQTMSAALTRITVITSVLAATIIPALAADEGRSNPSDPIVWGFLGFCALIIIAQIAPLIRNLKKQSKIAAEQAKTVKHQQL